MKKTCKTHKPNNQLVSRTLNIYSNMLDITNIEITNKMNEILTNN